MCVIKLLGVSARRTDLSNLGVAMVEELDELKKISRCLA